MVIAMERTCSMHYNNPWVGMSECVLRYTPSILQKSEPEENDEDSTAVRRFCIGFATWMDAIASCTATESTTILLLLLLLLPVAASVTTSEGRT
jgi:hypothetical protein